MAKKAIKITGHIIFWLVIAAIVFAIVGNFSAYSDGLYNLIKYRNYVVLTGSMRPDIDPGDYIVVVKTDFSNLNVGDDITFLSEADQVIVTHRIVKVDDTTVTTRGTANNLDDMPTEEEYYIGRRILTIPKLGYVISFLSSTAGLIIILGIVAIIIVWEITAPKKGKEKTDDNAVKPESLKDKNS